MKIIHTAHAYVSLILKPEERQKVREALNLAIVGHKNCNKIDKNTKEILPKNYPEDKLKKLSEAHWNANTSHRINIAFDITDEGEWVNFRIEQ